MTYFPALILALFGLGVVIKNRQAVLMFMGVEILLAAANWTVLLAVDQHLINQHVAVFVLFGIVVAAAEATIGLSIVMRLAKRHKTIDVGRFSQLGDGRE
jgi:NADH:ubiquinone oxidoreductase subunit K